MLKRKKSTTHTVGHDKNSGILINTQQIEQTIFVVDDDEAMCDSLKWLIESTGMIVETFRSAEAFLHVLGIEKYDVLLNTRPCCLVTDVCMTGMSGLELQDELIKKDIKLPIIFVTGHGNETMARKALDKGAVDFISKPFNDELLLERISFALG